MKILVVDDDADIRLILGAALRRVGGFEVVEAASLAAAVREIAAGVFDAILTDLQLPDGSGAELLAQPAGERLPVFVLTAAADDELRTTLLTAGARDVLVKPFDPFTVAMTLRQQLGASPGPA